MVPALTYLDIEELGVNLRVHILEVGVRGDDSFFQDQNCLDHSRKTTPAFQVSNIGLESTTTELSAGEKGFSS
jgi:hypothetical protein